MLSNPPPPQLSKLEERATCIAKAKEADFLDAVSLMYHFNEFSRSFGGGMVSRIEPQEVFGTVDSARYETATVRVAQLNHAAVRLGDTWHDRSIALREYEGALAQLATSNPGFEESSYQLSVLSGLQALLREERHYELRKSRKFLFMIALLSVFFGWAIVGNITAFLSGRVGAGWPEMVLLGTQMGVLVFASFLVYRRCFCRPSLVLGGESLIVSAAGTRFKSRVIAYRDITPTSIHRRFESHLTVLHTGGSVSIWAREMASHEAFLNFCAVLRSRVHEACKLNVTRDEPMAELALPPYNDRHRSLYLSRAKGVGYCDAVFALICYNQNMLKWSDASKPCALEPGEVLTDPDPMQYTIALDRARQLLQGGLELGHAYHLMKSTDALYRDEESRFRGDNPGFSELSYELARHRGLFQTR